MMGKPVDNPFFPKYIKQLFLNYDETASDFESHSFVKFTLSEKKWYRFEQI